MKNAVILKIVALLGVVALLMVGLSLVSEVVRDRQAYRNEATFSVTQSLAGSQTLLGPIIHSACVESWDVMTGTGAERANVEQRREFILTALPDNLEIKADAAMQPRSRGLHKVNTYALNAKLAARWSNLESLKPSATQKNSRMNCGSPIVMLAVDDARGIRTASAVLDGQPYKLKPGTFFPAYAKGVHAALPDALRGRAEELVATFDLELLGTERLSIVPAGGTTLVHLKSPWPHPSFGGRFLPADRTVGEQGFDARWRLSSLATTAQADVASGKPVCDSNQGGDTSKGCVDTFSIGFIDPINAYSLSDRATKYGVLFIALTFVAVGLFEFMKRLRVHPVQYLLVGSALCIFFLLLVSLSEHLPFDASYAVAASACVLLLTYYASHMLKGIWRGLPFGLGIGLLYGLLFTLLQLEQTALVVGAIALFVVLAAVMVLTRKVDWYARLAIKPGVGVVE
jgi:inner membrane protein